jgi:hypothetical protein
MPSTVIRRYAYRPQLAALDVEFRSGRIYRYHCVPPDTADEMRRWISKGAFLNRKVRGRFAFEQLPEWPEPDDPVLA